MSVNPNGGRAYNDHEVQSIFASFQLQGNGDTTADAVEATPTFQVTDTGLDRGEVAELVAARFYVQLGARDGQADINGELSSTAHDFGFNINEPVETGTAKFDTTTTTGNPTAAGARGGDGQASRELYSGNLTANCGYEDDTDGAGGPGTATQHSEIINFRDLTGRGPLLDRFDEFTLFGKLDLENGAGVTKAEHRYRLYFNVMEADNVGQGFGRP